MLNLPEPPRTRISRQLTCVSCHEQFTIAEDDPVRDGRRSSNWQLPTNHYPDIQLRYQSNRARRATVPEAHAIPKPDDLAFRKWRGERRESLHCPRCGADNRNWLNIINPPTRQQTKIVSKWLKNKKIMPVYWQIACYVDLAILAGIALYGLFAEIPTKRIGLILIVVAFLIGLLPIFVEPVPAIVKLRTWWQKFGMASFGLLATAVLVIFAANNHFAEKPGEIGRSILFLLSVALAGIVPTLVMIGIWRRQREYKTLRAVVPARSILDNISPQMRIWWAYTMLFLVIVPGFFFILVPGTFHLFSTAVKLQEESPEITLDEDVAPFQDLFILFLIRPDRLEEVAQTVEQNILQQVEDRIETANEAKKDLPPWLGADEDFFRTWFKYVLAASIAALIFTPTAVNRYIRRINQQVPPPIFHSVANMTRVVVWEAKHALEIGEEVQNMQWTAVQRNKLGGINLAGSYRDNNSPTQGADPLTTRVLAEHYEIISDRWGRIVEANVRPARVLQRPQHSRQREMALGDELFSTVPNQPLKSRRP